MALQFPPHVVALACIYLAALLSTFEQNEGPLGGHSNNHEIVATLRDHGPWEEKFQAQVDDLEGEPQTGCARSLNTPTLFHLAISHALLDLLISQTQNPSASTTPNTPSSPSPHISRAAAALHIAAPSPHTSDQLMRLKIVMRETEHPARSRTPVLGDGYHDPDGSDAIGRNEGTVRFLFGPNGGA